MTSFEVVEALEIAEGDVQGISVVSVVGPDAISFLDGQVTQDLSTLSPGRGVWSLLLEPDGHLGALIQVVQLGPEDLVVIGAQGGTQTLSPQEVAERLKRFKIRVKVDIEVVPARRIVGPGEIGLPPRVTGIAEHLELSSEPTHAGVDRVGRRATFNGLVSMDTAPLAMTSVGLGAEVIERAVSFTKGCYTGQELVARMDSRGARPPRRLATIAGATSEVTPEDLDECLGALDGVVPIEVVIDEAQGRFGGLLSLPRSLEDLGSQVLSVRGVPVGLSELDSGTER